MVTLEHEKEHYTLTPTASTVYACLASVARIDELFNGLVRSGNEPTDQVLFEHLARCDRCRHALYARFQVTTSTRSRLL